MVQKRCGKSRLEGAEGVREVCEWGRGVRPGWQVQISNPGWESWVLAVRFWPGGTGMAWLTLSNLIRAQSLAPATTAVAFRISWCNPLPQPQPLQGMGVNWVTFGVQSLKPSVRWRMEFWPTWYEQRT